MPRAYCAAKGGKKACKYVCSLYTCKIQVTRQDIPNGDMDYYGVMNDLWSLLYCMCTHTLPECGKYNTVAQ